MTALAPLIVKLLAFGKRVWIAFVGIRSGLVKLRHRVRDRLIRQGFDGERTVVERACERDLIGACRRSDAAHANGEGPSQQSAKGIVGTGSLQVFISAEQQQGSIQIELVRRKKVQAESALPEQTLVVPGVLRQER